MSGKVTTVKKLKSGKKFEVDVNFIEPDFFEEDAVIGGQFTIREASNVLGEGVVIKIV